jgi:hypothetical protein
VGDGGNITDDDPLPAAKKVDLGSAIAGLSKQLELTREAKEAHLTNQQKALRLLQKEYKGRLLPGAFLKAMALFKDDGNAVNFIDLEDTEYRDLWLETETDSFLS